MSWSFHSLKMEKVIISAALYLTISEFVLDKNVWLFRETLQFFFDIFGTRKPKYVDFSFFITSNFGFVTVDVLVYDRPKASLTMYV